MTGRLPSGEGGSLSLQIVHQRADYLPALAGLHPAFARYTHRMAYTYEYPHPAVTTDAVVFTVRDGRLEVLLIRRRHEPFKDMWAFPGGFVDYDEDLLVCAKRELEEETGVRGVRLEQFHAAGTPGRDPRERNISIVHMGLVRPEQCTLRADDDASEVGWFNAHRPPPLAFDQAKPYIDNLLREQKHDELLRQLYGQLSRQLNLVIYDAALEDYYNRTQLTPSAPTQ